MALAVAADRGAAKGAIAERAVAVLGAGFPFAAARTAGVAVLLALGVAWLALIWRLGRTAAEAPRGIASDPRTPVGSR